MADLEQFAMPEHAPEPPPPDHGINTVPDLIGYDPGLPANVDAEKTILGAVLLDNAAFDEAAETLEADDFSLDSHRRIWQRMADLREATQAIDIVTVSNELVRMKEIEAVGGVAYLAGLTEGLPRRPVIADYIRIVKDKALLRQVMMICSQAIARAADQSETALEVLGAAESGLLDISQEAVTGRLITIEESVEEVGGIEEYLAPIFNPSEQTGLRTGFVDYDARTGGLHRKDLIILAARPSMGKALPNDCMVRTLAGWKRIDALVLGDFVASVDKQMSAVTGVYPQGVRKLCSVVFSDGRRIKCDAEHLWKVYFRKWKQPRVLRTSDVASLLVQKEYRRRLWIDTVSGDFGEDIGISVHPWLLGALLGNGSFTTEHGSITFSSIDGSTLDKVKAALPFGCSLVHDSRCDYRIIGKTQDGRNILRQSLGRIGVSMCRSEHKRIPRQYLDASKESRVELLCGLMDTDGNVEKTGSLVYSTSSYRLALDIQELARSLGAHVTISTRSTPTYSYKAEKRTGLPAYRVYISHPEARLFVSLPRKRDRIKIAGRTKRLTFAEITPLDKEAECTCISVSHPSHLFVVGGDYIVTHNTAFALDVCCNACRTYDGIVVAFFSLEMAREAIQHRMMASQACVDVRRAMSGMYLSEGEKGKLRAAMWDLSKFQIHVDDSATLTPTQMRAKARRLKRRKGRLDLVVVDYLQLMSPDQRGLPRQEQVASVSRALKAMAKELDVPLLAVAQLNRNNEGRQDKRPLLSDLRESGQVEQDADNVTFIHRPEYYDRDDEELRGIAEAIIAKQRNGPTDVVKLCFMASLTHFTNLERG